MKISLCLIVKNEANNILDCLLSYAPVVSEMIVVDTGSTDHTKELVAKCGAKLFDAPWENDFSKARNISIEKASGDMILWTDADDYLSEENAILLHKLSEHGSVDTAYSFIVMNSPDGINGTRFSQVRMFPRREDLRFKFRVHEQIVPALIEGKVPLIQTGITVTHAGYVKPEEVKKKQERNIPLILMEMESRPNDPVLNYQHAGALRDTGNYDDAIETYRKAMELAEKQGSAPHIEICVPLDLAMLYYHNLMNRVEAERWARIALKKEPGNMKAKYVIANICYDTDRTEEAVDNFEAIIKMQDRIMLVPEDNNTIKMLSFARLNDYYTRKGLYSERMELAKKAKEMVK